ncbi:MAG: ABC transporter permease [Ignavibacteriaceae bacterium]
MILSLAWKNVWRNKKRSLIIIAAIAIGLWAGLFASGVMYGMWNSAINSSVSRELSHIQIHTPQFTKENLINYSIQNPNEVDSVLSANKNVLRFSKRVIIEGMASSASSSSGVRITGITPETEKSITSVFSQVVEGDYLKGIKNNPIMIGKKLAEKLGLKLHKKIILSFQAPDGNIIYAAFRIAGIFETESSAFDKSNVFVKQKDLYSLFGNEIIHEYAVVLKDINKLDTVSDQLRKSLPGLEIETWKQLAPELQLTYELLIVELYVFLGIILFALLFGITNTMLMSVIDRIREFGILLAVGMKRIKIFNMIIIETILLSLTGGITGIILGYFTILYFGSAGINLSFFADAWALYGLSSQLYTELPLIFYPMLTLMIIFTAVFSAIYPSVKAIRLNPAEAIRTF